MERRGDFHQRYLALLSELARLYEEAGDRFAALPGNLPTPLAPLVGRERELSRLRDLLQQTRLLSLTGPGGCGKTRLALEVAQGSTQLFPDGVWWIDLAPLHDAALVPYALAAALGLREHPDRPIDATITDRLLERRALLVLDNCEHLRARCAALAEDLLRGCPHLRILATGREGLGVPGETRWPVPPLSLPPPDAALSVQQAEQSEAVRLFVQRGLAARPSFALTAANARVVGEICRRLDGLPLAIELAAARLTHLTTGEIARRLDDRFQLLSVAGRAAHRRHATLRGCVDWSYALLTQPEQRLLNRLSVFTGRFTIEAAEAVCAGPGLDASEILPLLSRLVDMSLVEVEDHAGGSVGYRLLETIREYARERLEAAGEAESLKMRYAEHLLNLD